MAKKSKVKKLTETPKVYVSEKEVTIGGESAWLVKTENKIVVIRGTEILYKGSASGYHAWVRNMK